MLISYISLLEEKTKNSSILKIFVFCFFVFFNISVDFFYLSAGREKEKDEYLEDSAFVVFLTVFLTLVLISSISLQEEKTKRQIS